MSVPVTTSSLSMQNFFSTTLSSSIVAGDTVIPLNSVPTGTEGFLVIDQDNSSREVIYFNSAGGSSVTCPSAASGRGQGGTTAVSHSSGATVKMNVVSQYWTELQNGHALAAASITPTKLALSPQQATVATSEATTSTSYVQLATTTDAVTATIGANGLALVILRADFSQNTANSVAKMSFAVSGATTLAASDTRSIRYQAYGNNAVITTGVPIFVTGLTPGSNVFSAKYAVEVSGQGTFANRSISVIPL